MFKSLLNRLRPASPAPAITPADERARSDTLIAEGDGREEAGDLPQAEALYRAAIAAAPGHARAHLNLGIVLAARGDEDGAVEAYQRVLAIEPTHPFGNYNYARLAFLRGDLARAEALVAEALQAKPEFVQALVVQSEVLDALGRPERACESLRGALRLDPSSAGAWFNLAMISLKLDRIEDAEDAARRAVELEPDNPAALELLGRVLNSQGFAREALAAMQKVVELDPSAWPHRSMTLMLMNFVPGISADEIFRRHAEFGSDLERAAPVRFETHRDRGDPQRRLRIGYVSADLLMHPVTVFLVPLLENHDRANVEVFCYSLSTKEDPMTLRVRAATDHWCEAAAMSDVELADRIHADGIDVLVDLMGHTGHPRLGVFCQRPAPVQVAWLGYLNTTGLTRMDFRITDVRCDPPAIAQALHTEQLFNLPFSQWCYRAMSDQPVDPVSPFERNGHITFGSFNSGVKITPEACRRWAQVLLRVPDSRLVVGDVKSERKRAAILHEFAGAGIAPDRLEFLPRVPLGEYLDLYNRVDLTFDTVPYGGGTTTFDSLWMGAPVVATVGDTPVARSAASILAALGLDDWIAPSADEFVDVAVARAHDRAGLQSMRRGLRARLQQSPLTDVVRFTHDLESAYREMANAPAAKAAPPAPPHRTDDTVRADALIAEGDGREEAGELPQAEALYRAAIAAAPGHARAHLYLGIVLAARGEHDGAVAAYERVLAIEPAHPFANYNFARLALLRGELARAESLVAAAVRAKPDFPQALVLQSNVLDALGRHEPAIAVIREALGMQPDDPGGWFNLGSMLHQRGRPEEAEDALRRALAGDPDNVAALGMLVAALCDQGFADEALAALESASARLVSSWPERSLELALALYVDRVSAEEIFRRHARFGADLERAHPARFEHGRQPLGPARRLRVGYLSGDLLLHPVAFFLLPVIERHDRGQVEVFCYSFTRGGDKMTARLRELSDHWREVGAMTDDAIADAIHADGIDVLVDLGGHTGKPPRLAVFAQRPAPVQVSWLGYLCTTGLTRIDHRLTDRLADPLETAQPQHTERLQYLPASQWCYESLVHEPIAPGAPFERRGHLTFGSFNAALKITEAACRRWGELLARVPQSRLLVANIKSARKREAILRAIAAAGVDVARVTFTARVPLDQYLALHNSVDIALDSFPYGGGTTTLDAIYMGAPVAAAVGERSVSRSAASVLRALGLDDWVAASIDGWVDMVVTRAADRETLRTLRAELRPRLLASPLADMPRFVRDLEAAYRTMWEAACD